MVCNDLVRGLSLVDQRRDNFIFFVKFLSGHTDTGSGIFQTLSVFSVSKPGVIGIFVRNGTRRAFLLHPLQT